MPDVTATEAARRFSDLLDAVEHGGEHFTITRRGRVVAHLFPTNRGSGEATKALLGRHTPDSGWRDDLAAVRSMLELEDRE